MFLKTQIANSLCETNTEHLQKHDQFYCWHGALPQIKQISIQFIFLQTHNVSKKQTVSSLLAPIYHAIKTLATHWLNPILFLKTQIANSLCETNTEHLQKHSIHLDIKKNTRGVHIYKNQQAYLAIPVRDIKGLMILKNVFSCFR